MADAGQVPRQARLSLLRGLLADARHGSQQELADALAGQGVAVSQSTLSKDLVELGAIRRRTDEGDLVYALGDDEPQQLATERLARLCSEMVHSIRMAANQLVLRTPPGAAQYFAAALDASRLPGVIGTIAGDDTILVIGSDEAQAERISSVLSEMTRTGRPTVKGNE